MGLLNINLPTFTSDVVGVFDSSFGQIFPAARPMRARIKETTKFMEHPIETGATIIDHRIIEPVVIDLLVILNASDYRSVYEQIRNYRQMGALLTVQTKVASYDKMVIADIPHEEEPAMFNTVGMMVRFIEAQFVSAQYDTLPESEVADPANASTQQRGQQQSVEANTSQAAKGDAASGSWIWRQTQ